MCNVIVNLLQVRVSLAAVLTEFFHHDAGLSDSLCINAYFHNVFLCVQTEKFKVAFLLNFLGSLMPGMCVPFLGRTSNKIAKDGFNSVVFILYTVSRFTSAYLHISFYCVD